MSIERKIYTVYKTSHSMLIVIFLQSFLMSDVSRILKKIEIFSIPEFAKKSVSSDFKAINLSPFEINWPKEEDIWRGGMMNP